jgi:alkylation response protein AidB-like acyl-CoA dehydrogenase
MGRIEFIAPPVSPEADRLRLEVREFLRTELSDRRPRERAESWVGYDADFSRKLGQRGWIGMTWPKKYGGHERSALERYVVLEELLVAGAPVAAHWFADRQSGPLILRSGSEQQKLDVLPRIARGECFTCVGISEPDVGSDAATVRTRAARVDGGFLVNGTKLWTTNAHRAHYMVLFCRTGTVEERQLGTSQFLVDMKTPGIEVRPILAMSGEHHFNEVVFRDVFLPETTIIGAVGEGWKQVTAELVNERSGPERFLSSYVLFRQMVEELGANASPSDAGEIGRLIAHIAVLRRLSRSVAGMLQSGAEPSLQAAVVKDLGAVLEQEIPELARRLIDVEPSTMADAEFPAVIAHTMLHAPSFSLRGGAREILRGIIARGLGLR